MIQQQDRRRYHRVNVRLPVGVVVKDLGGRFFVGNITNVSGGGLAIIINTFLPVNTKLSLTFEFQENHRFENVAGIVIRSRESEEKFFSAINFDEADNETKEKINKYIKSIVFLRKIKPFNTLTDEETWFIRKISNEVSYKEGHKIFTEGTEGDGFYIVLSGKVKIVKESALKKEEAIAMIKEGEFFGEMSLLDESKRSASAIAFSNAEMFVIKRDDFKKVLSSNDVLAVKLLWVFIKTLSLRLREIDDRMADLFFTGSAPLSDLENK